MQNSLYRANTIIDLRNNLSNKIYFVVKTGPLCNQVICFYNLRYDKVKDILHYNYEFEREIEIEDGFNFNEYLDTLLKHHLAFKD